MRHTLRPVLPLAVLIAAVLATPRATRAQQLRGAGDSLCAVGTTVATPADTLHLGALEDAAVRADPRSRQLDLVARQSALRIRTLSAERLPTLGIEGQAQHQSVVVHVPIALPNGAVVPSPPNDTYDSYVGAQESLFDPTRAPRRAVERSRLAESQSEVRATLYGLRAEVEENFFAAALLQSRASEIAAASRALDARLAEARTRVREGASLPSDTASIAAALLQRGLDETEARADRAAALARLAELTGRPIVDRDTLVLPVLDSAVASTRQALATPTALRGRPEFEQFAAARELLARQAEVSDAGTMPRVSAYARAGYGRPGLNLLGTGFNSYWLAGVQVKWTPWNWGNTGRERQELELQQRIVAASEAAFAAGLRRAIEGDLTTIDRLAGALATDDRVIALRERVERETGARLREGVATGAEYVDRSTELLGARLARAAHRVELTQAQAHLLTTIGVEVR